MNRRVLFLIFISSFANAETPYHIKSQFYGFSYVSPYRESSIETRYRFSLRKDLSTHRMFDYTFHTDLWKLTPREAADWMDVPEAYLHFRREDLTFKLGRILPSWGNVDYYSPVQDLFPKFSIDPLSDQNDGIVGGYVAYDWDLWQFEVLLSPIFIPTRGGVRFETDESGHFYVASRWGPPLHYRVRIGDAIIPLDYNLHIPELKEVIFKPGVFFRTSYVSPSFQWGVIAANAPDPEPKIQYDAKLHILDESQLMGRVNLYPGFDRMTFLGLDAQYGWKSLNVIQEMAYIRHDKTAPQKMKGISALMIKPSAFLKWLSGISYVKNLEQSMETNLTEVKRSNPYFFSRLEVKLLSWMDVSGFTESSFKLNDTVVNGQWTLFPFRNLEVSSGIDLLAGSDESFWGQLRSQDRIWMKVRYAL